MELQGSSSRSPWGLKTPKSPDAKAESATSGLAGGDSLAAGEDASMEKAIIARRRRARTNRGSVAAREMGKAVGRSRLLWLKNNWVLVALIILALLGFIIMLALLTAPCEPNVVAVENQVVISLTTTRNTITQSCIAKNTQGQDTDVGVDCNPGNIFVKEECDEEKCVEGVVKEGDKPVCLQNCTDIVSPEVVCGARQYAQDATDSTQKFACLLSCSSTRC